LMSLVELFYRNNLMNESQEKQEEQLKQGKEGNIILRSSVLIPVNALPTEVRPVKLEGDMAIPKYAKGIVLFAHGSGSGRFSPRNKFIAEGLNADGLATLLVDLLTQGEEQTDIRTQKMQSKIPGLVLNKFNIKLLANRLVSITGWILHNNDTQNLILGYFGASTGAAAALTATAATKNQDRVGAIVSRSGRPDLAGSENLKRVKAPTLFILGGNDHKQVIELNKQALKNLGSEKKKLVIVPNATHLFEEPGTLEEVAKIASGWFRCYFQIREHSHK
jgi:putative phosphoribosyl transferase